MYAYVLAYINKYVYMYLCIHNHKYNDMLETLPIQARTNARQTIAFD